MTLELHRYIVDRATALKEQGDGVPILFVPFSDWHLGNAGTDHLQLEKLRPTTAVTGNHDWWTKSFAGIDYLNEMLRRLDIASAKHRLRLILEINGIKYRIEHRHQSAT